MGQTVAWNPALSIVSRSDPTTGCLLHVTPEASVDVKIPIAEIRSLRDRLDLDIRSATKRDLRLRGTRIAPIKVRLSVENDAGLTVLGLRLLGEVRRSLIEWRSTDYHSMRVPARERADPQWKHRP